MDDFVKTLETKWGNFEKDVTFYKQCNIKSISSRTYLNVLFVPLDNSLIRKAEKALDCRFPTELLNFYKRFNGMVLFSQSFRIFGINKNTSNSYETLDIVLENMRINVKKNMHGYSNLVSFGYYAEYSFFFDKKERDKIFVISRNNFQLYHTFDSIKELFDYYIPILINKYDTNGIKIDKTEKTFGNLSDEFI